jgi:hypothetical protein
MALMQVYNTTNTPVVYGDGKIVGGLEWAIVDDALVQAELENRTLIIRDKPRNSRFTEPVVEIAPESTWVPTPEIAAEDSSEPEIVVPSNTAEEETPEPAVESVVESPVDTAATPAKPATMRKTRRRKTTPPVKE